MDFEDLYSEGDVPFTQEQIVGILRSSDKSELAVIGALLLEIHKDLVRLTNNV